MTQALLFQSDFFRPHHPTPSGRGFHPQSILFVPTSRRRSCPDRHKGSVYTRLLDDPDPSPCRRERHRPPVIVREDEGGFAFVTLQREVSVKALSAPLGAGDPSVRKTSKRFYV